MYIIVYITKKQEMIISIRILFADNDIDTDIFFVYLCPDVLDI